jgi:hypothetical protein
MLAATRGLLRRRSETGVAAGVRLAGGAAAPEDMTVID